MAVRLHIIAEGQTEERFVKDVLSPHLGLHGVFADARCVLTSKDKKTGVAHRGGFRLRSPYSTVKRDICTWMKEDRQADVRFTTMFDLYALPDDFPGFSEAQRETDPYHRVTVLERALEADINGELNDRRFVPYIQLHEFEALVLADARQLDWEFLEHDAAIARLADMIARETVFSHAWCQNSK